MTLRAADLPIATRRRLALAPPPAPRARKTPAGGNTWRCGVCGLVTTHWTGAAGAQTHANETGHARVEIVWGEGDAG